MSGPFQGQFLLTTFFLCEDHIFLFLRASYQFLLKAGISAQLEVKDNATRVAGDWAFTLGPTEPFTGQLRKPLNSPTREVLLPLPCHAQGGLSHAQGHSR